MRPSRLRGAGKGSARPPGDTTPGTRPPHDRPVGGGVRERWALLIAHLGRNPLAVLVAAGLTGAVVSTLANVGALALGGDAAHLRDLQAVGIPTRLVTLLGSNLIYQLPEVLARSRDVSGIPGLLTFAGAALLLTLTMSAALVTLAALPTALAWRRWPPDNDPSTLRAWWWGWGFPAAALIALCVPGIQAVAIGLAHGLWEQRPLVLRAVASAGLLWAVVAVRPRRSWRLVRPLAVTACASAVTGILLLAGASLAATGAVLTAARQQPAPAPGAPNLLIISIDTLRADHLHCYGYPRDTSPAIDDLARGGALFSVALAHTPWTLPSHLTLLSGLPPEVHGVSNDRQRLAPGVRMLAQSLWAAGYATAGFVSLPYLRTEYGFGRGFDSYDDWSVAEREFGRFRMAVSSPGVVGRVRAWLSNWARGGRVRPFFLFVHLADVHNYFPPPPYDTMFGAGGIEESLYTRAYRGRLGPAELDRLIGAYDGGVRSADAAVAGIVEALRRRGTLDDTMVVVAADHGEAFYEHGEFGHGRQLYNESVRVPLIIRFPPRVGAGTVVPQPVGLVDVVPTVLGLLAGPGATPRPPRPPGQRFGHDLTPLLNREAGAHGPEWPVFGDLRGEEAFVVWRGFKLIRHLAEPGLDEVYDERSDPAEHDNLAASAPAVTAELGALLADWRLRCTAARQPALSFRPDAEHLRNLRALGYL